VRATPNTVFGDFLPDHLAAPNSWKGRDCVEKLGQRKRISLLSTSSLKLQPDIIEKKILKKVRILIKSSVWGTFSTQSAQKET